LIVRKSMSWIDGAGFGGLSLAGSSAAKEGGGLLSSCIARTASATDVDETYDTCTVASRTTPGLGRLLVARRRFGRAAECSHRLALALPRRDTCGQCGASRKTHKIFGSKTMTGLGSLIAARSIPFA
jgi:hypothetical protein